MSMKSVNVTVRVDEDLKKADLLFDDLGIRRLWKPVCRTGENPIIG